MNNTGLIKKMKKDMHMRNFSKYTYDSYLLKTKDISTFEDYAFTTGIDETGMVYLYLPNRSRTITLMVNGKTYSGTVETIEEGQIIMLE